MDTKDYNDQLNYKAVYNDSIFQAQDLKTKTLNQIFDKIKTSDYLKKHTGILRTLHN